MNPHVSLSAAEIAFPVIMTVLLGVQLWRLGHFRHELLGKIGLTAVVLAMAGASFANLFYQGVMQVRAWPTVGLFDQVVVTPAGDLYANIKDPIMGRAHRVQRYSCRGELMAAFQSDNQGGLFKIGANSDDTLSIYSVRNDSIDTFAGDGTFLHRRVVDSQGMPFNFLNSGPSVTRANNCEYVMGPVSGQPAVKNTAGVWRLERGDWMLEYALSRQNIIGAAVLGVLFLVISYVRRRNRRATGQAA